MATLAAQNPRYEADENPPVPASLGYGFQFSFLASASLLVTPVIVAKASGRDDSYLTWMVFASLIAVGLSTLVQVRRIGPVGSGAVLPMFTAAFSIPFCITAVVDGGPATLTTLLVVAVLTFRGTAVLRLWAPMIGIAIGCAVAAGFGIYEFERILRAPWIGLPSESPGLTLDFGIPFWTILPSFLFLGVIISIQANGEAIAQQRVSRREARAIDFRQVQGTLAGTGVGNLIAGAVGAVPIIIHPGAVAFYLSHRGCLSQSRLLHRFHVHRCSLPAQGVHPAQHHTRAGDDRIPHHGHRDPVCRRRADGHPD